MGKSEIIGAFGEDDASRLSGVSVGQLRSWDRDGFLLPSYGYRKERVAYGRVYSFKDLVALRVLNELRNDHKVSLQHLKKVAERLAHLGDDKWTSTKLYVLGKKVVWSDPRTRKREEIVSGQRVFDIPLKIAVSDTKQAIQEMNVRQDAELGKVETQRFVQNNRRVFSGTRILVSTVENYLRAGLSSERILADYPDLRQEDIESVRKSIDGAAA